MGMLVAPLSPSHKI